MRQPRISWRIRTSASRLTAGEKLTKKCPALLLASRGRNVYPRNVNCSCSNEPERPESCRVGGGISAAAPHRSGRESLDSSGSCRPVIRACTAGPSARTGQAPVPGPLAAILAHVCRYVPVACTSTSPFFFNDTATTEIDTLSLHDALPI